MCVCVCVYIYKCACFADLKAVIFNFSQISQASLKCVSVTLPKEREKILCQIHQPDCLRGRKSWYQCQPSKAIRYDPVSSSLFWQRESETERFPVCATSERLEIGETTSIKLKCHCSTLHSITSLTVWEVFSILNDSVYKAWLGLVGLPGQLPSVLLHFCTSVLLYFLCLVTKYLEEVWFPPLIPPAMCTHTQTDTDSTLLIR